MCLSGADRQILLPLDKTRLAQSPSLTMGKKKVWQVKKKIKNIYVDSEQKKLKWGSSFLPSKPTESYQAHLVAMNLNVSFNLPPVAPGAVSSTLRGYLQRC